MLVVTHKTINDLVRRIEANNPVKFVCISDSFLYKLAMKKLAGRLGIIEAISDKFLENYAITMPWMFGKNIVVTPYRLDDRNIDPSRKLSLIAHEFQHVLDAQEKGFKKFYSDYISNSVSRASYEARALASEIEIMALAGYEGRKTTQFGSMIYMFSTEDLAVITKHIDRVKRNLPNISTQSPVKILEYIKKEI